MTAANICKAEASVRNTMLNHLIACLRSASEPEVKSTVILLADLTILALLRQKALLPAEFDLLLSAIIAGSSCSSGQTGGEYDLLVDVSQTAASVELV